MIRTDRQMAVVLVMLVLGMFLCALLFVVTAERWFTRSRPHVEAALGTHVEAALGTGVGIEIAETLEVGKDV